MYSPINRNRQRQSRVRRGRAVYSGTANRPRLSVYRSLTGISVQLIDDVAGTTMFGLTDRGLTGKPLERAKQVGEKAAEEAKKLKITHIVFDRAGYKYHGRVAALAEGARSAGLIF